MSVFFFQAEDGIRDLVRSRGLGDVCRRQSRRSAIYVASADQAEVLGARRASGGEPSVMAADHNGIAIASPRGRLFDEALSLIHI